MDSRICQPTILIGYDQSIKLRYISYKLCTRVAPKGVTNVRQLCDFKFVRHHHFQISSVYRSSTSAHTDMSTASTPEIMLHRENSTDSMFRCLFPPSTDSQQSTSSDGEASPTTPADQVSTPADVDVKQNDEASPTTPVDQVSTPAAVDVKQNAEASPTTPVDDVSPANVGPANKKRRMKDVEQNTLSEATADNAEASPTTPVDEVSPAIVKPVKKKRKMTNVEPDEETAADVALMDSQQSSSDNGETATPVVSAVEATPDNERQSVKRQIFPSDPVSPAAELHNDTVTHDEYKELILERSESRRLVRYSSRPRVWRHQRRPKPCVCVFDAVDDGISLAQTGVLWLVDDKLYEVVMVISLGWSEVKKGQSYLNPIYIILRRAEFQNKPIKFDQLARLTTTTFFRQAKPQSTVTFSQITYAQQLVHNFVEHNQRCFDDWGNIPYMQTLHDMQKQKAERQESKRIQVATIN